jgi:tetratricopeptide (TPR) repeat protein
LQTLDSSTLPSGVKLVVRSRPRLENSSLATLDQDYENACSAMKMDDLYAQLDPQSSRTLSRAAVYLGPLTQEAILIIGAGLSQQQIKDDTRRWRDLAFAHVELGSEGKLLSIYGSFRGWLTDSSRLSDSDWRAAHDAAAQFLEGLATKLAGDQRHADLRLSRSDCLRLARLHYLAIADGLAALKISRVLNEILMTEHQYDEVLFQNTELLEYIDHPEPATWVAKVHARRSDYENAKLWYNRALGLAKDIFPIEQGHALQGLAKVAWHRDQDAEAARCLLGEAKMLQISIKDVQGEGLSLHQLGSIDFDQNFLVEARSKIEDALRLFKGLDARADEQVALHQLGSIDLKEGKFDQAKENFHKALAIARSCADTGAEAAALHQLGRTAAQATGDPWAGFAHLRKALELRQSIGDAAGESQTFQRLGELLSETDLKLTALQFLIISQYLYGAIGDRQKEEERAADVNRLAAIVKCKDLASLVRDVKQQYLNDRGQELLEAASTHITTQPN